MRPQLNPALRLAWRDEQTLQVGADPERAVVVRGLDAPRAAVLALLDGTRSREQVLAAAAAEGLARREAGHLLDLLGQAGALLDAGSPVAPAGLAADESRRLAPDLASWSLHRTVGTPTLRRRRASVVAVDGAGRVGATLVGLLAAAGVGEVVVRDPVPVREPDLCPGGHHAAWLDRPRALSALATARATAPSLGRRVRRRRPDVVALCPDGPDTPLGTGERFVAAGLTHVVGTTYERVGVVGPLVRPGRTPCLRCLELHRRDRDAAWPLVAAQLRPSPPQRLLAGACDVVLAAQVAAGLATAVLAEVDDPAAPHELAGARLELRPPSNHPRRRSWPAHPGCGCGWPGEAVGA